MSPGQFLKCCLLPAVSVFPTETPGIQKGGQYHTCMSSEHWLKRPVWPCSSPSRPWHLLTPPTRTEAWATVHKGTQGQGRDSEGRRWTMPTQIIHPLHTTQHSPLLTQNVHNLEMKEVRTGCLNSCPAQLSRQGSNVISKDYPLPERLKWLIQQALGPTFGQAGQGRAAICLDAA